MTLSLRHLLLAVSSFILLLGFNTNVAYAEPPPNCAKPFLGIPHWYQYLPLDGTSVNGAPATCEINTDPSTGGVTGGILTVLIFMGIFDILMYLAGLLAVIFIIYGGFQFLTSAGEPQKIAAARKTILNAIVGLIIAIVASQIVSFVAGRLNS